MTKGHEIRNVAFEDPVLQMEIDGALHAFDLTRHSKRLAHATPAQRANLKVSPSGYGIHWPDVDEDLSISGLIRGIVVDEPNLPDDRRLYENPAVTYHHPHSRPRPLLLRILSKIHDRILGINIAFLMDSTSSGIPMPTILFLNGWKFFFHANEGNEPLHVHCVKGDADAKYWLNAETYEITEAYADGMSPADKRNVRKIIFDHFDYFVEEWNSFQELKK